ncbi:putative endonuclease/exonuclease/phosphatase family protein [Sulfitobacter noctilucicola]|uniref:Endonuclease/exonuclease/phosphatase family metal-dependent hydrolase n=1 Tax=Sulfitobacter noctilucicola TaxID=1342301 RepID=A0A7W6Q578_9RHOB|nr:endonuclease/exonuclease/phosphatase family protein [Sulfitobacter noctilucicola]KIN61921.1 putative endonuclease/exonuclease/phosphatase family protein [Sulfitobacter noctilucicola]MBB4173557.1 endonuclease/exonuclease/phosphatase family metal-dependent hydrolase [Sulfitobacter noctilucicola]
MTQFTIASFNVKNLIGPDKEYYKFQSYTPEEYAWKEDWLAEQLVAMNADIVGFQEIFEESALRDTLERADELGHENNEAALPGKNKKYRKRAIFKHLAYHDYSDAALAFAPNVHDGDPGQRRPGVAILSRLGFAEAPQVIQVLDTPLDIPFATFGGDEGGFFRIHKLSRPILKARVPVGDQVVTVFNCHLKSKLGEYIRPEGAAFATEADLTNYDPVGRALGAARATMRRMAEAWVLRGAVIAELRQGRPVIVLGDLNDHENAVSSEIITGEVPFKNYAWMLRHDAEHRGDRYSDEEAAKIAEEIEAVRLHSAEKMFVRKSLRDMVYTSAFGGHYESIDQILMSRHFTTGWSGGIGEMTYFSVLNDHLTDGSHPEAPYNKLASDHGQIMATIQMRET